MRVLLMLLACWSVGESEDYFATVPFTTPYAETQTGVVETVRTSLECPDGQNARFYVVHDQAANPDAPVAVVLHSSAFDYVITPDASEPLGGQHFAGVSGYSRLETSSADEHNASFSTEDVQTELKRLAAQAVALHTPDFEGASRGTLRAH